ncbi:hypothetical protein CLV52_1481 [Amnibacterium kyonggiense]|uniref:Uncharacterized protein n=1 Tax=Amnibacterium kyonggiense TaxID=595671 RepID=A0A4R7FSU1_9MICO|nr:hypothetical protein CLV52_1481 [Amnibacterium kyonggiense]
MLPEPTAHAAGAAIGGSSQNWRFPSGARGVRVAIVRG